jgi:hypothetical protein
MLLLLLLLLVVVVVVVVLLLVVVLRTLLAASDVWGRVVVRQDCDGGGGVCLFVCYVVCGDWFVHFCLGGLLWLADPLGATRHGGQRRRPR